MREETPYTLFFEHAVSRAARANDTLKSVAAQLIEHPDIALQFIASAVKAGAFRAVYREVYDARNLQSKETEDDVLRRIKTYAEDRLRLLASNGMILSTGPLGQGYAAEVLCAWADVLECLKDVTRNGPKGKKP